MTESDVRRSVRRSPRPRAVSDKRAGRSRSGRRRSHRSTSSPAVAMLPESEARALRILVHAVVTSIGKVK
jgi:hypothetical protein